MPAQPGDKINRIGDEVVDGIVLRVTVDLGQGGPGNVVEVQIGDTVQSVFADACRVVEVPKAAPPKREREKPDRPIAAIPRDGATMPSGSIDDVIANMN